MSSMSHLVDCLTHLLGFTSSAALATNPESEFSSVQGRKKKIMLGIDWSSCECPIKKGSAVFFAVVN